MVSSWIGLLFAFLFGLSVPLPLGIPPRPEDPTLIRAVPRDVLAAAQWFGLASADPRSTNAAERFAAHDEVRQMFAELDRAALQWCMAKEPHAKDFPLGPLQAAGLLRVVLTNPGIAFVAGYDDAVGWASLRAGLILRLNRIEGADPARRLFDTLKAAQARLGKSTGNGPAPEVPLGSAVALVFALPNLPRVVVGLRGDHVFLALGDGVAESVVQGLERHDGLGAQPEFVALHAQVRTERPLLRVFARVPELIKLGFDKLVEQERATMSSLGIDGLQQLLLENGLEGDGLRCRAFIAVQGEPRGIVQALGGTPLSAEDLAPIPADASLALAARLQPSALLDLLQALLGEGDAPFLFARYAAPAVTDRASEELFKALRADLVAGLSDVLTVWNSPGQGGLWFTGATLAVPVRDKPSAQRALDRVLALLRARIPAKSSSRPDPELAERLALAAQQLNALQDAVATQHAAQDGKVISFEDLDWDALGNLEVTRAEGKPPHDPWGRAYRLVARDGQPAAVTSDGADGRAGTEDDVRSDNVWQRQQAALARSTTLEQTALGTCTIHYLNPRGYEPFAPAWSLTDTHLMVSLNLSVLKAALHHLHAHEPGMHTVSAVTDGLGGSMVLVQNTRGEFPLVYAVGTVAAGFLCRSMQEDGFDLTVDALPSAVAFREVLGHETLSLRPVPGGLVIERRGRLPNLLGVLPLLPLPFFFAGF